MNEWILFPIVLPLLMATLSLLPRGWRFDRELMAVLGTFGHLVFSVLLFVQVQTEGIQVLQAGGWAAPYGITLVADLLSATLLVITGIVGFAVVIYSLGTVDELRQTFGYFPMLHVLLLGCSGAFLAGDIFNLYVWFEVILISSFVLLTLGGEHKQILGGVKYVTLNLVASAFFLTAIGLLYYQVGSLNFADVAQKVGSLDDKSPLLMTELLLLLAFLVKAGAFPFFFWLPASYHTPPVAVAALFAALLTKVGVYVLFRFSSLLFTVQGNPFSTLLLWLAGFTMVLGVLGAWSQTDMRRILSFHIISQIGYILMGLGLFSQLSISGGIYFMIHNIFAKANLFLIAGIIAMVGGSFQVKKLGGLFSKFGFLGVLFLISAMSLAGIPPLSGFFGKFTLIKAGLSQEVYPIVITSILVSVVTLLSMLKIWHHAFWQDHPDPTIDVEKNWSALGKSRVYMLLPAVLFSCITVSMGVFAEFFLSLTDQISTQLSDPNEYIQAVLGGGAK